MRRNFRQIKMSAMSKMQSEESHFVCKVFLFQPSTGHFLSFHVQMNLTGPEKEWKTEKHLSEGLQSSRYRRHHLRQVITLTGSIQLLHSSAGVFVSSAVHTPYMYKHLTNYSLLPLLTQYEVLWRRETLLTPSFVAFFFREGIWCGAWSTSVGTCVISCAKAHEKRRGRYRRNMERMKHRLEIKSEARRMRVGGGMVRT